MKGTKASELRDKTIPELEDMVKAEQAALYKARRDLVFRQLKDTAGLRGRRKVRQGIVVSSKMEKTVVVKIERRVLHPLYGKVVLRSKRFKAHDEIGCDEGDRVEIMETRPISKDKRWRVTQIIEKVK